MTHVTIATPAGRVFTSTSPTAIADKLRAWCAPLDADERQQITIIHGALIEGDFWAAGELCNELAFGVDFAWSPSGTGNWQHRTVFGSKR